MKEQKKNLNGIKWHKKKKERRVVTNFIDGWGWWWGELHPLILRDLLDIFKPIFHTRLMGDEDVSYERIEKSRMVKGNLQFKKLLANLTILVDLTPNTIAVN